MRVFDPLSRTQLSTISKPPIFSLALISFLVSPKALSSPLPTLSNSNM